MARHQVNIAESVYQELDKYRLREDDWTESWTDFFRRLIREKKLSK